MTYPVFASGDVLNASDMNGVGLWHITTVTPTAATVVAVNNCLSSDYTNYRILVSPLGVASSADIRIKLRSGSTPSSTGYYMTNIFAAGGSISSSSENNQTSWRGMFTGSGTSRYGALCFDLFTPFASVESKYIMQSSGWDGSTVINRSANGFHDSAVSYNGFELSASSNITATIQVFGYNKGS
jgi:hypothetical protein